MSAIRFNKTALALALPLVVGTVALDTSNVQAGRFIFGDKTYPIGYRGEGATLDIKVCLSANTSADKARLAEQPLKNAIARWNRLRASSSNIRDAILPDNKIDFESVAVHELGHCNGLGHPNLGSSVGGEGSAATAAAKGPNNRYDLNPGFDGVYGTDDDERGDDENLYVFNQRTNNPFTLPPVIDGTSYSRDLGRLPARDLFPVNARRGLSAQFGSPNTEAVMQNDIFPGQTIRSVQHDDVATIRYAMSGLDGTQGTADDYRIRMNYAAPGTADCNITVEYNSTETAAASCVVRGQRRNGNSAVYINSGTIYFNEEVDWFYNQSPPCNISTELPQNRWRMISLPCDVGVSTSAKLRDVFGDDLDVGGYGDRWALFEFAYSQNGTGDSSGAYRRVELDDELSAGTGYWMLSKDKAATLDVQGEYPSTVDSDVGVDTASGSGWNLLGSPFRVATPWSRTRVVAPRGQGDHAGRGRPGDPAVARCARSRVVRVRVAW